MYGQNPVRKRTDYAFNQYRVQDIFYTLQGEGPYACWPALFIRLAGCNLRCTFCDTDFESKFDQQLVATVLPEMLFKLNPKCKFVVLTGGEPFLQHLGPLMDVLVLQHSYHVQIETAGTLWQEHLADKIYEERLQTYGSAAEPVQGMWSIVVSPKTGTVHASIEKRAMAFKYIVADGDADPQDGLPVLPTQATGPGRVARPRLALRQMPIYVQPKDSGHPGVNAANVRHAVGIAMQHNYRVCLQQHKILNLE